MPKKFFYLIFIFFFQTIFILFSFANPVLAVSCKDLGILHEPAVFAEQSDITVNFQVQNQGTVNYLKNGVVKLEASGPYVSTNPIKFGNPIYYSQPEPGNQTNFYLTIVGIGDKKGDFYGKLTFSPSNQNNFQEFCQDINFEIGASDLLCTIDKTVPDTIPPNSPLTVRFQGSSNTNYDLKTSYNPFPFWNTTDVATSIKTDGVGFGEFPSIQIQGKQGNSVRISISGQGIFGLTKCAEKAITLNAAVSPQPSLPPRAKNLKLGAFGGETAKSAGIPCPGGIETAIGCIPTDPTDFVKGFLRFAVGAAGGLALLIMAYGAFRMITSAGNPDSLKEGHTIFTNAIIGLLFIIFSTLLLKILGVDILGLGRFLGI